MGLQAITLENILIKTTSEKNKSVSTSAWGFLPGFDGAFPGWPQEQPPGPSCPGPARPGSHHLWRRQTAPEGGEEAGAGEQADGSRAQQAKTRRPGAEPGEAWICLQSRTTPTGAASLLAFFFSPSLLFPPAKLHF